MAISIALIAQIRMCARLAKAGLSNQRLEPHRPSAQEVPEKKFKFASSASSVPASQETIVYLERLFNVLPRAFVRPERFEFLQHRVTFISTVSARERSPVGI
jgi:hypothetical protein